MSKRKVSVENKIYAVNLYLDGKESQQRIAHMFDVSLASVQQWIRNYESMGANAFTLKGNKKYSKELKQRKRFILGCCENNRMLVLYFIFLANIFCTSSFHGASFSNSFWADLSFGRFSNKKFKYLYTFRSYAFAISIIVKQIALALAPSTESQNNQFFLPTVIGRIAFSLRLLLRLHLPSSRYVISESFRFRM